MHGFTFFAVVHIMGCIKLELLMRSKGLIHIGHSHILTRKAMSMQNVHVQAQFFSPFHQGFRIIPCGQLLPRWKFRLFPKD